MLIDLIDNHRSQPLRFSSTGSRLFVASNCSDELTTGSEYCLLKSKNFVILLTILIIVWPDVKRCSKFLVLVYF